MIYVLETYNILSYATFLIDFRFLKKQCFKAIRYFHPTTIYNSLLQLE